MGQEVTIQDIYVHILKAYIRFFYFLCFRYMEVHKVFTEPSFKIIYRTPTGVIVCANV